MEQTPANLNLWIDGDACPKAIKEVILKASQRTQTQVVFVANRAMQAPKSPFFKQIIVNGDFDAADHYIAQHASGRDIVITADIPLADLIVAKCVTAINPRGEVYTAANIKDRLSTRNLMAELRSAGTVSGGPRTFSAADVKSFSSSFDRCLTAALKALASP